MGVRVRWISVRIPMSILTLQAAKSITMHAQSLSQNLVGADHMTAALTGLALALTGSHGCSADRPDPNPNWITWLQR